MPAIDGKTTIPISVAIAVVVAVLGACFSVIGTGVVLAWRASGATKTFEQAIDSSNRRTEALEESTQQLNTTVLKMSADIRDVIAQINGLGNDRFRMTQAAEVALRTKIANPTANVVDPRDPTRFIGEMK